jgi:hypothetical protein
MRGWAGKTGEKKWQIRIAEILSLVGRQNDGV